MNCCDFVLHSKVKKLWLACLGKLVTDYSFIIKPIDTYKNTEKGMRWEIQRDHKTHAEKLTNDFHLPSENQPIKSPPIISPHYLSLTVNTLQIKDGPLYCGRLCLRLFQDLWLNLINRRPDDDKLFLHRSGATDSGCHDPLQWKSCITFIFLRNQPILWKYPLFYIKKENAEYGVLSVDSGLLRGVLIILNYNLNWCDLESWRLLFCKYLELELCHRCSVLF